MSRQPGQASPCPGQPLASASVKVSDRDLGQGGQTEAASCGPRLALAPHKGSQHLFYFIEAINDYF